MFIVNKRKKLLRPVAKQYLVIYNNENLPNGKINYQSWFKILPNTKYTLKSMAEDL